MSQTLSIQDVIITGAGSASYSQAPAWGGLTQIDESLGIVADQLVAFATTVAKLKVIVMSADVDATVKTNSSGAPQETISLKAGAPLIWISTNGYFTVPFAGNVTALYVTTTVATVLKVFCLYDPT